MEIEIDYIISISIALGINMLSACTGTLKTIFIAKENKALMYLTQIIDAGLYAFILKMPSINGAEFIITYTVGRLFGTIIANRLNDAIGLEIINVDVYIKDAGVINDLQFDLLSLGYSSTLRQGFISEDCARYDVEIQVRKRAYKDLEKVIIKHAPSATIIISPIKSIKGKIKTRKAL